MNQGSEGLTTGLILGTPGSKPWGPRQSPTPRMTHRSDLPLWSASLVGQKIFSLIVRLNGLMKEKFGKLLPLLFV